MTAPEPVSAHALLVEQHAFLRRLARSLVSDPERADDLAQDVAVLALRHPPKSGTSPRAWLARVLRNRATSVARSESRRRDREANAPEPAPQPTPPELEARLRVQRQVIEAVSRLEEPYRSAILLRYDQGLTPTAIAERLGVPVATVKTRLARALERLRRDLDAGDERESPTWSVVLLAGFPDIRPQVAIAAAAAGGSIVATKLVWTGAAIAAVALAGGWWTLREPAHIERSPQPLAADTTVPVDDPMEAATGGVAPVEPRDTRTAAIALDVPESTPDWALVLRLNGLTDERAGLAHVSIFDGRAEDPRIRFERELRPSWTIDVGALFARDASPPGSVRIEVDHPLYLPAEVSVLVPADWKDDARSSGRLEADLGLRVPKAILSGVVELAEDAPSAVLGAAIYAMRRGRPVEEPVDRMTLEPSRRFRLRADPADEHVVVAFVDGPHGRRPLEPAAGGTLRPASRVLRLPTIGSEEMEIDSLLLEVGATISGRLANSSDQEVLVTCAIAAEGGRMRRPLTWLEDRFENGPLTTPLASDSTFRISGLAPIDYVLHPNPVMRVSSDDPDGLYRFWSAQDSEVSVRAPAQDVTLRFQWVEVLFEVIGGGMPVPRANLEFQLDAQPGREGSTVILHASAVGENGRMRLQCSPEQALRVKISDPRYDTKEFRFAASELVSGAEFRLEFDGPAVAPPTLVVSFDGDLDRLGRPDGIGFTAFECSSRSDAEVETALSTPFLAELGPSWGYEGAIHLGRVQWDALKHCWSTDELRPGRYVVATRRATFHEGERSDVIGGAIVVDLRTSSTVHAVWTGTFGGNLHVSIVKSRALGPDLASGRLDDQAGKFVPVLFKEIGGGLRPPQLERLGNYVAVPTLPPGEYLLHLNLSGGAEHVVELRIDAGRTTEVRVDLADL